VTIDSGSKFRDDSATSDSLSALRAEFDRELAYLREPGAGAALLRLFREATPELLAQAANAAARRGAISSL